MKKIIAYVIFSAVLMSNLLLAQDNGDWRTNVDIDPITDQRIIRLSLESNETKNTSLNKCYIYVRFNENNKVLQIYISWGEYLGTKDNNKIAIIRYNKEAPIEVETSDSTNNKASFLKNPEDILNNLLRSELLAARIKDQHRVDITRTFNLAGLNEAIAPYLEEFGL